MTDETDNIGMLAMRLIKRYGKDVQPVIQGEIEAATARGDWDEVGMWSRVRLRAARILLTRERAEQEGWRPIYPKPAGTARVPWTKLTARRLRPGPSAA